MSKEQWECHIWCKNGDKEVVVGAQARLSPTSEKSAECIQPTVILYYMALEANKCTIEKGGNNSYTK